MNIQPQTLDAGKAFLQQFAKEVGDKKALNKVYTYQEINGKFYKVEAIIHQTELSKVQIDKEFKNQFTTKKP